MQCAKLFTNGRYGFIDAFDRYIERDSTSSSMDRNVCFGASVGESLFHECIINGTFCYALLRTTRGEGQAAHRSIAELQFHSFRNPDRTTNSLVALFDCQRRRNVKGGHEVPLRVEPDLPIQHYLPVLINYAQRSNADLFRSVGVFTRHHPGVILGCVNVSWCRRLWSGSWGLSGGSWRSWPLLSLGRGRW